MAFVRLAFFPEGTSEHYTALLGELRGTPAPVGRLAFMAGPLADGWQVVQVWTDKEQLDSFNQRWLLPALERLGSAGFPQPPVVRDFVPVDLELGGAPVA